MTYALLYSYFNLYSYCVPDPLWLLWFPCVPVSLSVSLSLCLGGHHTHLSVIGSPVPHQLFVLHCRPFHCWDGKSFGRSPSNWKPVRQRRRIQNVLLLSWKGVPVQTGPLHPQNKHSYFRAAVCVACFGGARVSLQWKRCINSHHL